MRKKSIGLGRPWPRYLRLPLALLVAGWVNWGLLAFLSALTFREPPPEPPRQTIRTVWVDWSAPSDTEPQPQESFPETPNTEPEVLEIDLDLPQPQVESIEPLDLIVNEPVQALPSVTVRARPEAAPPTQVRQPAPVPETTTWNADQIDQPPRPLAGNRPPRYPVMARRQGQQGTVATELLIDEHGHVVEIRILQGPNVFVESVRRAAMRWRFTKPVHQGRSVRVWGKKSFVFQLES